jgi:hypothetical protein
MVNRSMTGSMVDQLPKAVVVVNAPLYGGFDRLPYDQRTTPPADARPCRDEQAGQPGRGAHADGSTVEPGFCRTIARHWRAFLRSFVDGNGQPRPWQGANLSGGDTVTSMLAGPLRQLNAVADRRGQVSCLASGSSREPARGWQRCQGQTLPDSDAETVTPCYPSRPPSPVPRGPRGILSCRVSSSSAGRLPSGPLSPLSRWHHHRTVNLAGDRNGLPNPPRTAVHVDVQGRSPTLAYDRGWSHRICRNTVATLVLDGGSNKRFPFATA